MKLTSTVFSTAKLLKAFRSELGFDLLSCSSLLIWEDMLRTMASGTSFKGTNSYLSLVTRISKKNEFCVLTKPKTCSALGCSSNLHNFSFVSE